MLVTEMIELIFVSILSFCSSIIKRFSRNRNIYFAIKFIIHIIFAGIVSILLGAIGTLFGLIAVSPYISSDFLWSYHAFLPLTFFLFAYLSGVISLNWNNNSFNLPNLLFILYSLLVINNPKKKIIQAFWFIFIFTIFSTLVSAWSILYFYTASNNEINDQLLSNVMVMCLSFSFLFSVIIFSYGTIQQTQRLLRQFFLWFVILICILIFSGYQLYIKLQSPINGIVTTEIVLLVLGLVFIITTVADKGNELFRQLYLKDKRKIGRYWRMLNNKFRAVSVYQKIRINSKNIYSQYLALQPKKRITFIVLLFGVFVVTPVINMILDKVMVLIDYIIQALKNEVWRIAVSFQNGDKEQAKRLLMLIFFAFLFIYLLRRYICSFKSYSLSDKLLSIGPSLLVFVFILIAVHLYLGLQSNVLWSFGLLLFVLYFIIFVVFNIFTRIMGWFKK